MPQHFIKPGADWGKAAAVGLSLAICVACPAWAQTTVPATAGVTASKVELTFPDVEITEKSLEFRQFEKVEITGSAILAKEAKQALPLQILDRRDIERSGAASLPELLQRLPLMSNFSELGTVTATTAGGPEAAAIHGNQSGTLVLLNGRRLPYYGNSTIMGERTVVDLNFLPLAAIEKIEILTDGASSRYGSDAIAGVINVITKAEVQGLSVGVETSFPQDGHGQSKGVNLSWGNGRLQRDGYSLRAHFMAQKTEAVLAKHREVSSQGARSVQIDGKTWWQNYRSYPYSAPGKNFIANGVLLNEHYLQTGQCERGWYELKRGECQRNAQGDMTLYPETDKQMLHLQGDRVLGNRWVVFAEGVLGRHSQTMVPDGTYWTLDVPNVDQTRTYLLDIVPLGFVKQRYTNRIHNFTLGLRGEQFGWDFMTSFSSGRHRVLRDYVGGLLNDSFNFAQVSPDVIAQNPSEYSAETLANMKQHQRTTNKVLDDGFNQMDSLSLLASREWMDTEYGPVNVGFGLDGRRERVFYSSPDEKRPGFDVSRFVWAAHTEVTVPLGHASEITGALRHDQYSDFGGVQTGKLGWKWKPQQSWLLRGSVGTGFRAPTLGQMVPLSTAIEAHQDQVTKEWISILNMGNPHLKPERSIQQTLGIRYEPDSRWSLGADLWQVDIQDTFGVLTGEQILRNPKLRAQYYVDGQLHKPNQNLGRSLKRGLDYDLNWRLPTDLGRVRTSLKGVYMLKSAKQDALSGVLVSNIGSSTDPALTTARHQWTLTSLLERPQWVGGFRVNYKTGYEEQTVLTDVDGNTREYSGRIPAHWTLDLLGRWQIQPKLTLSAHLINVTNRMPALRMAIHNNAMLGVDTSYANYMGRNLQLKLDYKF
jgi:iron complex outermembrane receptor protein